MMKPETVASIAKTMEHFKGCEFSQADYERYCANNNDIVTWYTLTKHVMLKSRLVKRVDYVEYFDEYCDDPEMEDYEWNDELECYVLEWYERYYSF